MSIWIRRIFSLAIAVLKTKASIYQTVPGDSFISRLVDEVEFSHPLGPMFSKNNVQTQTKHQFSPFEIRTPLSSSEFELENLRRPSKSKRKFGDFFSEESQDGQNMNQKSWSETEPSRGLHSLDFTYSHLERSGDNYNPTAWNTQHENIPGDFKLLYPTNHPYSSRSEFEDLEDLGSFSQNSDFWNTFIEKLQPETAHDQDEIHKNKEAEKNLSALALQNTVSRSNLKTKKKKTHNPFDEYNLKRQLKKMMAYKVPDPSSSIEENHIEKYLDKIFNVENEEKILAHDKNLNVNEEANLIHEPKSDFEVFHKGRNFDSKTLQETKGPPIYGIFGLEQRKNGVNKEIDVSENRRTSHKSHRASPAVNKDRGTSKKRTFLQKGSRAYERQRLEDCLDDFYKTKLEENVIFGGKDNKKQVKNVTLIGFRSFLNGLKNYAEGYSPIKNYAQNQKSNYIKLRTYFEEQEIFQKKFNDPFCRFLSHKEKPLDRFFLDKLKKAIEKKKDYDGYKSSVKDFFSILDYMIKKNKGDSLFIKKSQLNKFFWKPDSFFFQLKRVGPIEKHVEYQTQANYASDIVKVFSQLNWKNIFTADHNAEESENMKLIFLSKLIPSWAGKYTMYAKNILIIRNLFIAYSTLINKIFCEDTIDYNENFLKRQKGAINFFDSMWSFFKIEDSGIFIIENNDLPLKEIAKKDMLNSFICSHTKRHFQIRINDINKNRNETLWKIIHFWLIHSRYDFHKQLITQLQNSIGSFNFKCFLQSLFLCIIKCYE